MEKCKEQNKSPPLIISSLHSPEGNTMTCQVYILLDCLLLIDKHVFIMINSYLLWTGGRDNLVWSRLLAVLQNVFLTPGHIASLYFPASLAIRCGHIWALANRI